MPEYDAMTTFAKNLKEAMRQGGWTQQQLAEVIGIKPPRISELLNGKTNPTLETMEKFATALNIPVYQLLMPIARHPEKVA